MPKKCLLQGKNWKARRVVFKHTISRFSVFDEARATFSANLNDFPPRTLRESVYTALCFFDIFDHPLTFEELFGALIGIRTSTPEVQKFLAHDRNIEEREGFYFLKGREHLVELRKQRDPLIQKYQKKIRRYLPFIQKIPYVRMAGVCNTLAMGTANGQSDIDLFIITAPGRIFLARTLTTFLFSLLGVRRHGAKIAGRFCLSFYMSEEYLDLKKIMHHSDDIYLIYWFRTLQPIYGKSMYKKFIQDNAWIDEKYFPSDKTLNTASLLKPNKILEKTASFWEFILDHTIGNFLEKKLAQIHLKRHQKKRQKLGPESSVVVDESMLKFHNVDRRREFFEKFQKKIRLLKE